MTRPARRDARGYTMIEVMMAMAILAVGATGIMAIQKSVTYGNINARNIATANAIAMTWAERLRADAVQWNTPNDVPDLGDTRWLNKVTASPNVWFVPLEGAPFGSPRADILGADLYGNAPQAQAFCTHIRLVQLYPTLIRAEIRVFYARTQQAIDCAEAPDAVSSEFSRYGFVYVTTGIEENLAPN